MNETDDPTPPPGIRVLGQPPRAEAAERVSLPEPGEETEPAAETDPAMETDPAGSAEPASSAEPDEIVESSAGEAGAGHTVRPGVLLALVLISLVGVIGTVTFGLLWAHERSQQSSAKSVESASRSVAQKFLTDFTTFGPSTVAQTFSDIQALSTGSFASQARTEFSPSLRQQLQAAHASTQGQVRYLELQSFTAASASYFADVVQTFSNDKTSGPQSDELRLLVDLSRVKGQWKVSGVTSLDTPAASGSASGG